MSVTLLPDRRGDDVPQLERRLLRDAEARRFLGVGRTTLWKLAAEGKLPTVRILGAVRYDLEDLERFVADSRSTRGR